MPLRVKLLSLALIFSSTLVLYLFLNSQHTEISRYSPRQALFTNPTECPNGKLNESITRIRCMIEGVRPLQCIKSDGSEVYMPFSYLKKQYDLSSRSIGESFNVYTSSSKIRFPETGAYDPFGPFDHFATYNVGIRDRVRCVNPRNGVPMSVQWSETPYFYPIQIAQYALQHYSQNKTGERPRTISVDTLPSNVKTVERIKVVPQSENMHGILRLETSSENDSHEHRLSANFTLSQDVSLVCLLFSWKPKSQRSWYAIVIQDIVSNRTVTLKYKFVQDDRCIWQNFEYDTYADEEKSDDGKLSFTYSLGSFAESSNFLNITIDAIVETTKAFALLAANNRVDPLKNGDIRLVSLQFFGPAEIQLPIKQQSSAHYEIFLQSIEWFLQNQDSMGGWPVPVQRAIAEDRLLLKAGWHSAMAQGHALSVLTRAFNLTGRSDIIQVCRRALHLFRKNATEGGVSNNLFGHYWYEEYPTTPGTYVLNGFLYSLIGLYDASMIPELKVEATELFDTGVNSLRTFLPLYDTGVGSVYDLRHLGLKSSPNIARWDYHALHVYLLKWLYNITDDKFLNEVADRWAGYAHGKRAKHN
ncbi:D-glucuronyl C5-epimerase [Ditylenchus destructor]|nr:D-glucuronyl C5-epimerase [Ditylenchus destructor]